MPGPTVIVDYGMGNLRSVQKAFESCGDRPVVSHRAADIRGAARLVVPGVGAFGQAMKRLRSLGLAGPIRDKIQSGAPYLGICLGLQMLFESSEENPREKGLGVLKGKVVKFSPPRSRRGAAYKVPHMGWNTLEVKKNCPLLKDAGSQPYFYFVHSYYAAPANRSDIAAITRYPKPFCSAVQRGNIFATQFHPEKSQQAGLRLIRNFLSLSAS